MTILDVVLGVVSLVVNFGLVVSMFTGVVVNVIVVMSAVVVVMAYRL